MEKLATPVSEGSINCVIRGTTKCKICVNCVSAYRIKIIYNKNFEKKEYLLASVKLNFTAKNIVDLLTTF